MTSMKRFGLAALFAIGAALLGGTPALAAGTDTMALTCVVGPDDPDYAASGVAKLSKIETWLVPWWGGYIWAERGQLSVACKGLTPGATYWVTVIWSYTDLDGPIYPWPQDVGVFTASGNGAGAFITSIDRPLFTSGPHLLVVSREEKTTDGAVEFIPVLAGELIWP
jgi:hypothetical protein